jgi:Transposase IS116/IS110/IS902 family
MASKTRLKISGSGPTGFSCQLVRRVTQDLETGSFPFRHRLFAQFEIKSSAQCGKYSVDTVFPYSLQHSPGENTDFEARDFVEHLSMRSVCSRGRDFAAWLGLVPRQMSTGDRTILGSISKRGNRYLRGRFVQGKRKS